MNFLEGRCTAAGASGITVDLGALGTVTLPRPGAAALVGKTLAVGIRPEHLHLDEPGGFRLTIKPGIIERLGIHTVAYAPLPNGDTFVALFEGDPMSPTTPTSSSVSIRRPAICSTRPAPRSGWRPDGRSPPHSFSRASGRAGGEE